MPGVRQTNSGVVITSGGVGQTAVSSLPDTSMFSSPLYQYYAGAGLSASDGNTASAWTEQLAGAGDATVTGTPTYRANQDGRVAVEYDGSNDGHDWPDDGNTPEGNNPVSVAATIWLPSNPEQFETVVSYGNNNGGEGWALFINDSAELRPDVVGTGTNSGGTVPTGQWSTVGCVIDGSTNDEIGFINGSQVVTNNVNINHNSNNRSIGYRGYANDHYADIYINDMVICDAHESDTAFSDYHNDRI